jgi:LysM repeat protein
VNALGLAAAIGTRPATGDAAAGASQGPRLGLTDAVNMADAALGYHQTSRAADAADRAVADAERALSAARLSGDAAAIAEAEANLRAVRRSRAGALMGAIGAGDSLMQTAAAVGQKHHELRRVEQSRQVGAQRAEQLLAVLQDPRVSAQQKQEAMAALLRLTAVGAVYESALQSGDIASMRQARAELERIDADLRARPPGAIQIASVGVRDVWPTTSDRTATGDRDQPALPETGGYRVAEGDTLWQLARNYGLTVDDLLAVNPDIGADGMIRAGQVVRIPMPKKAEAGSGSNEVVTIEIPPPAGLSSSPAAPSQHNEAASLEGWGSFWEGVFYGDFAQNDSWSAIAGQVVLGLVPYAGQAADLRDTLAAFDQVREGQPGSWITLLAAGVGWVPGAGDGLKAAIRGGRKAAGEALEEVAEQAARRVSRGTAEEASEVSARSLDPDLGPKSPRSPLGEDVSSSYPDPDPRVYRSGLRPDSVVVDHVEARALRGHPTDPSNLNPRAWSENASKGWHEGEYLRLKNEYMRQGLTERQAEWVLEDYRAFIQSDIFATSVDPVKLDKLSSP